MSFIFQLRSEKSILKNCHFRTPSTDLFFSLSRTFSFTCSGFDFVFLVVFAAVVLVVLVEPLCLREAHDARGPEGGGDGGDGAEVAVAEGLVQAEAGLENKCSRWSFTT